MQQALASERTDARRARGERRPEEITRLREHFLGAIQMLMARDVSRLTPAQRSKRQRVLDDVIVYAVAGVFPRNTYAAELTPAFVDRDRTRCAVAYLLEQGDRHDLVREIATHKNLSYVPEFATTEAFADWLDEHGLTVEEAARIQPAYCTWAVQVCLCQYDWSALVTATMVTDPMMGGLVLQADGVYGTTDVAVGDLLPDAFFPVAPAGLGARFVVIHALYVPGTWEAIYAIKPDGMTVDTSTCDWYYTPPPQSAPLAAIIGLAQGQTCPGQVQGPGWDAAITNACGAVSSGGQQASSSAASGGTGGGGGGSDDSSASGGGCSFTTPSADVAPLLMALVAGIAIARRRARRPDSSRT